MFQFEFLKIHKLFIEKKYPPPILSLTIRWRAILKTALRYIDRVHVPEGTALPNRECPSAVL